MTELDTQQILAEELARHEQQHIDRMNSGENPSAVDLSTSVDALSAVIGFCQILGYESRHLTRLMAALMTVKEGSTTPGMLKPSPVKHRRPATPASGALRGKLAAVMEYKQATGLKRKEAAAWVARNLTPNLKKAVGAATAVTVDGWLVKWGGKSGNSSEPGRIGYESLREILNGQTLSDAQLKAAFEKMTASIDS